MLWTSVWTLVWVLMRLSSVLLRLWCAAFMLQIFILRPSWIKVCSEKLQFSEGLTSVFLQIEFPGALRGLTQRQSEGVSSQPFITWHSGRNSHLHHHHHYSQFCLIPHFIILIESLIQFSSWYQDEPGFEGVPTLLRTNWTQNTLMQENT